jgi:hypothetical protein
MYSLSMMLQETSVLWYTPNRNTCDFAYQTGLDIHLLQIQRFYCWNKCSFPTRWQKSAELANN